MKKILLFSCVVLLLFSCSGTVMYSVRKSHVDDLAAPYDRYRFCLLDRGFSFRMEQILIDKNVFENGDIKYMLTIFYQDEVWRNMSGEVKVKIDDKLYTFKDDNVEKKEKRKDLVTETIEIPITREFIAEMAQCSELKIQFWEDTFTIWEVSMKNLKRFYNEHVK